MSHSFGSQLEASDVLKARFNPIYEAIADDVEADTGVRPAPEDIYPMSCVRTAVFAGTDDWTAWRDESALIPAIAKAKERERLQDALERDGDSPEARAMAKRLAEMTPAQKLSFARQHGLTGAAKAQNAATGKDRTPEETAALIRQAEALPAGMRLAFCRKHGLS
ncbi:hypothetical protein [Thalassovita taeanensis]|uniref:Uncharacterized protein n=1 Tax=Thalassovita taeanensis TaxID=657014 RepID=A0A1H9EYC8_9RHOB|nr:hypothetical protein [Thalassovita taeanensis]SEQ29988.1 hypothetical protein SAMN04488092_105197 [Thalassovita taeanensis]